MAAVIRMKRHINEEPLNAFVLNCKRARTDSEVRNEPNNLNGESRTILKFAGTVNQVILNHFF